MSGSLGDLMATNWLGLWEGEAQACGMAPVHLEHVGQDGKDTDTSEPAIKEMEDKTRDSSKVINPQGQV